MIEQEGRIVGTADNDPQPVHVAFPQRLTQAKPNTVTI